MQTAADQQVVDGVGSSSSPPKRKAEYVTVESLVNSQYNIDLQRLNDELHILKAQGKETTTVAATAAATAAAVPQAAEKSGVRSFEETKENKEPRMRSSSSQSSFSLAKHHQQSRLQPPRDGFNLCVLVGTVELVVDKCRVDGSRVLVAEVEVGDETGSVSLRARDEQIDLLRQVSSDSGAIVLRNCTVELYQGKHLRLAVSKWGKMSVYPDGIDSTPNPPSRINQDLNFSLVDLNLVATSKSPSPMPTQVIRPQSNQKPHRHQQQGDYPRKGSPRHQYYRGRGGRQHLTTHQRRPRSVSNASPGQQQHFLQTSGSPRHFVHYQQFAGDDGSVYSFHSTQQEQTLSPQHSQSYGYSYSHPGQQDLMYQQYRLQQQHEHQLQLLQRQQESQRRMLQEQQQLHQQLIEQGVMPSSLIPDLSLDIDDYSLSPPTLHYSQISSTRNQPNSSHHFPSEQYSFQVPTPIGDVNQECHQQQRGTPSYASVISPTSSPRHFGRPGPQPHQYHKDEQNP